MSLLSFVKKNHNKIIKWFRIFIAVSTILSCFGIALVNFLEIPNEVMQTLMRIFIIGVGSIGSVTILLLLISYLSPDETEGEYIISGQSLIDMVDEYQKELSPEEKLQEYVEFKSQITTSRIHSAIRQQEKKSVINLVLGILFSLSGAITLIYIAQSMTFTPKDVLDFVSNFLPRLSLVLLIETFAYFFLRLYKENLAEIKYWHDELTAIEHRNLSLNLSLKRNDDELIKTISATFSRFEKNYPRIDGKSDFQFSANYLVEILNALKK